MENLTGGTPPVRPLPCVVPCKLYCEAIEETDRKKILIVGDSLTSDIRGGNLAQIVTCWYNPNGQKADSTYRIDAQIQDLQEVIPLLSQSW